MSDEEAVPGKEVRLHGSEVRLREVKKRLVPFEQDDPQIEPLFINFAHGAVLADDVLPVPVILRLRSLTCIFRAFPPMKVSSASTSPPSLLPKTSSCIESRIR